MYTDPNLENHLAKNSVIESEPLLFAEINMNSADNLSIIGNYRNRNGEVIQNIFVEDDVKYVGYTDSDVVIDSGISSTTDVPLAYASIDEKKNLLFSLEDCFEKFRPRSGINKAVFYGNAPGHYLHHTNPSMMTRPRYYMPSKNDKFKYWTSFRKEGVVGTNGSVTEIERGIANKQKPNSTEWYIDDASPFVVYKEAIPTNRIIIKTQTHVGTTNLGSFYNGSSVSTDPLYDEENVASNRVTPKSWRVDALFDVAGQAPEWRTIKDLSGTIVPRDGYIELEYSLISDVYVWSVANSAIGSSTKFFTEFSNPASKQIQYIRGLRVVVDTMNKKDATLDVIEISPRLAMDITDIVTDYKISKIASDLGTSGMPVGQLLASTGSMTIADYDQVLNLNNTNSVIAKYVKRNTQVKIFDIIKNVDVDGTPTNMYIPVKTMYVESFPEINSTDRTASLALRDLYFYFESLTAPEALITNASLSYILAMLFDSIGFSNYVYKKSPNDKEPVIPNFFVAPNKTVAQILQELAVATQTSMFFDEYNNFVCMSKSYMLADAGDRNPSDPASEISKTLYGTIDSYSSTVYKNQTDSNLASLSNIIDLSSKNNNVYNDGKIVFNARYIQKSYTETRQASLVDEEKIWKYQPALLWQVAPNEATKSINEVKRSQSAYSLAAIPLNSNLSATPPYVSGGIVRNNVMDLGEGIYWIPRYNGYFYANGEIIRYDAVEYNISQPSQTPAISATLTSGNTVTVTSTASLQIGQKLSKISGVGRFGNGAKVKEIVSSTSFTTTVNHSTTGAITFVGRSPYTNYWISSQDEYQEFFAKIPFGGKLYPTGRVRIYSEPNYVNDTTLAEGAVAKHGREQFGTKITTHYVGLPSWVTSPANTYVVEMDSSYLFGTPYTKNTAIKTTGVRVDKYGGRVAKTSVIRNYMSSSYYSENQLNTLTTTQPGTVQSSALVMTGPAVSDKKSLNLVSYVRKDFGSEQYNHFGSRIRIIGTVLNNSNTYQIPSGADDYYSITSSDQANGSTIKGASGGIGIFTNPTLNTGYFFEIVALSEKNLSAYGDNAEKLFNIVFYKTFVKDSGSVATDAAIPLKLWTGLSQILVDDGRFTGQYRISGEQNPTVYDLAVEYKVLGNKKIQFFLYLNNNLVGSVIDDDALPSSVRTNSMSVFSRGESKVMFENIYAVKANESANYVNYSEAPLRAATSLNKETELDDVFLRKYCLPEAIQTTYLSKISPIAPRGNDLYFEEFGTIMREAAYFNIKYDKAYPALYAQIMPTFNKMKSYAISGFIANAYGAEFLIFNTTDKTINLDNSSGNWLQISGVTFTQESRHEYTVDEYFKNNADLSDPAMFKNIVTNEPLSNKRNYMSIVNSRASYGKKEFTLESDYIQSADAAESLMGWMIKKIMKPRISAGISVFPDPTIQLGDIVTIDYKTGDSLIDEIAGTDSRFVVYNIEYGRDYNGPAMTLYVSQISSEAN